MVIGSFFCSVQNPHQPPTLRSLRVTSPMRRAQNPCIQGIERQLIRSHYFRSELKLSPTLLIFLIIPH
jgi:hypothetical protein